MTATDSIQLPPSVSGVSGGATFLRVLHSEWTKLWSLRSTFWSLLATFVVTVGITTLSAWTVVLTIDDWAPEDRARFDPTLQSMVGLVLGQLAIAVLGVLVISSEYSTGGVKTTFTAVPQRLKVLVAKAVALAGAALLLGLGDLLHVVLRR